MADMRQALAAAQQRSADLESQLQRAHEAEQMQRQVFTKHGESLQEALTAAQQHIAKLTSDVERTRQESNARIDALSAQALDYQRALTAERGRSADFTEAWKQEKSKASASQKSTQHAVQRIATLEKANAALRQESQIKTANSDELARLRNELTCASSYIDMLERSLGAARSEVDILKRSATRNQTHASATVSKQRDRILLLEDKIQRARTDSKEKIRTLKKDRDESRKLVSGLAARVPRAEVDRRWYEPRHDSLVIAMTDEFETEARLARWQRMHGRPITAQRIRPGTNVEQVAVEAAMEARRKLLYDPPKEHKTRVAWVDEPYELDAESENFLLRRVYAAVAKMMAKMGER